MTFLGPLGHHISGNFSDNRSDHPKNISSAKSMNAAEIHSPVPSASNNI